MKKDSKIREINPLKKIKDGDIMCEFTSIDNSTYIICHGCDGKGWVDTKIGAQICPICNGSGILTTMFYQT